MTRLAQLWAALLFAVALFAPLIANDAPIVAKVNGELRFPAFRTYFDHVELGPDPASSLTWMEWWARLPDDSAEWAVMPPWPYGPLMERQLEHRNAPPSLAHPFGVDDVGRDMLSRLIWGAQTAFLVAAGAVLVSALVGVPLGAVAGYRGGIVDAVLSVLIEVFLCFPALFLALIAAALLGSSSLGVILVLGSVYWTSFARLVRGEFLSLREREFVLAARGLGLGAGRIVFRHMLPTVRGPLLVNAAFLFAGAIIVESTLAFLGLGTGESWGTILASSREPALRGVWHLWVFPALTVISTVWCFHSIADAGRRK